MTLNFVHGSIACQHRQVKHRDTSLPYIIVSMASVHSPTRTASFSLAAWSCADGATVLCGLMSEQQC